jgi:hypothetical protein
MPNNSAAADDENNDVAGLCQSREKIGARRRPTAACEAEEEEPTTKRIRKKLELVLIQPVITVVGRSMFRLAKDILIEVFRFLPLNHMFRLNWHSRTLAYVAGKHHGVAKVCSIVYYH